MYSVLKFGGTSMGSKDSLEKVKNILEDKLLENNNQQIVVVSAMSGMTNLLLEMAKNAKNGESWSENFDLLEKKHLEVSDSDKIKSILSELWTALSDSNWICELTEEAYFDYIASFGERLSAQLLGDILGDSKVLDTRNFIKTDNNFGNAKVDYLTSEGLARIVFGGLKSKIIVCTGFIARSGAGATTTLGRGGSDYTAGLIANFLDCPKVEIWTDVSGVLSGHPKLVANPKPVENLSYREAFEVAYYGGKVLYPKTMEACVKKNIEILVKNTFEPKAIGTLVSNKSIGGIKVVSVVEKTIFVEVVFASITSDFGLLSTIFGLFAKEKNSIDVVSTSGDSVSFSCEKIPTLDTLDYISTNIGEVKVYYDKSILAIIGNEIDSTNEFDIILKYLSDKKPFILTKNSKNTNFTAVINNDQVFQILKDIHNLI